MRLFVDNLTNVDFSYLCPERGLLGETWLASIELEGPLDQQGMVCDFGIVKKQLRQWLDDTLDHKLLVPSSHANIEVNSSHDNIQVAMPTLAVTSPAEAIVALPLEIITPVSVAQWCEQQLAGAFGAVEKIHIRFEPEIIDGPYYHYSHGLKKHAGNCQRIAHGHRSKIIIWQNNELDFAAMETWALRWEDIYLATREDCVGEDATSLSFQYRAPQGEFSLRIAKHQCYFLETDTTVEHIAQHIANELAKSAPGNRFRVKAFEGISKGAIVEAFIAP